jgi:hypothetical protein
LDFLTLEDGQIHCPETSVKDYHSTLHYTPADRRSHKLRVFENRVLGKIFGHKGDLVTSVP